MDIEIEILLENMVSIKEHLLAGFKVYTGTINDRAIALTCCGVGKVNAAACTQMLIDKFNVGSIINTGIAGSLKSDVKICDVVVSTIVTHYDVRKEQMKNCSPNKAYFEADSNLVNIAQRSCEVITKENHGQGRFHLGKIVSGEAFVSEKVLKAKIIEEHSPHCVEMEGAAIGHVAYLNSVPFVVIRSISDNADEAADLTYKQFEAKAAHQSANIVLEMLKLISNTKERISCPFCPC